MSKPKKGILVKYQNKEKKCQRGIAYYSDQTDRLIEKQQVFVRVVDNRKLEPIFKDGRQVIVIKNREDLTIIGYID